MSDPARQDSTLEGVVQSLTLRCARDGALLKAMEEERGKTFLLSLENAERLSIGAVVTVCDRPYMLTELRLVGQFVRVHLSPLFSE